MSKKLAAILWFTLLLSGCTQYNPTVTESVLRETHPYYHENVQPIFDAKCVACHSCFNAPCQLDLSSFEGIQRGASKTNIYDFPLVDANAPTRLGIDAQTTTEWRRKGFFSVLDKKENVSILSQVLQPVDAKIYEGHTFEVEEGRMCQDDATRNDFFKAHPRGHMPYGFPSLTAAELLKINLWLNTGARAPSLAEENEIRTSKHAAASGVLKSWEDYLNQKDLKARLRSRYIYEHLFLALISFDELTGEHYKIVRARNLTGEPIEIPTVRPFDSAGNNFHYRFKKYIRTVMDKTNMPYALNAKRRARWKQLFDDKELLAGGQEFPAYGDLGSNAFKTFKRLSPQSRYEFLLDDAYYHIMTFIKGPVCRGPTALSVINDHFWVMFMDPALDPTLKDPKFMSVLEKEMFPPTSAEDKIKPFNQFRENFWDAIEHKYSVYQKANVSFSPRLIWNGYGGENKSALLTVFRHYDSAQVMQGAFGPMPKTVWVLDYQILEDIYYNLVAGYNVFGPVIHQMNTRLYMEISRVASEDLFLNFMAQDKRHAERKSWTQEAPEKKKSVGLKVVEAVEGSIDDKMHFKYPYLGQKLLSEAKSNHTKEGLIQQIFAEKFVGKNYILKQPAAEKILPPAMNRPAPFVSYFPDVTFVKVKGAKPEFYTLARNRFHYNVSMLFFETDRLEPAKDYLSIVEGVGASYPNQYLEMNVADVGEWQRMLKNIRAPKDYERMLQRFGVSRHRTDFWDVNEWFYEQAKVQLGRDAGRFDLSRFEQF